MSSEHLQVGDPPVSQLNTGHNMDQMDPSHNEVPFRFSIGQHDSSRSDPVTLELLDQVLHKGYDMATTPITTPAFHASVLERIQDYLEKIGPNGESQHAVPYPVLPLLTPDYTTLAPHDANASLIGFSSPWIDMGSSDPLIAHVSKSVYSMEIAYAAFCGINHVIVPGPIANSDSVQFGRTILEGLGLGPYLQLYILLPMTGELELDGGNELHLSELAREQYSSPDDEDSQPDTYGSWEVWNTIRTMCEYESRCSIALELPRGLPPKSLQGRWLSEPVRLLVYPHTSFIRNAKNFPVLSQVHQDLLSRFMRQRFPPWILLSDTDVVEPLSQDPAPAEAQKWIQPEKSPHLQYLRYLQDNQPARTAIERFGQGYQDYLQSPLQPLADNLESITYEVFEKDPVKYEWYERAIAAALKDLSKKLNGKQSHITVAVVGAGRGPLVTRALQASRSTGVQIHCWAVEKNPNAFVLLQRRNATDALWNKTVQVVKSDMRYWTGPPTGKVDILVSELLGSFADNELSPECLDGVQHVLHPDHGINIPQSYSAHLTPISSSRLHADILCRPGTSSEKWEIPYVVMLQQFDYLSIDPTSEDDSTPAVGEAWHFSHPAPQSILDHARLRAGGSLDAGGAMGGSGSNEHNSRTCKLQFKCANRGICHGLGAYFETVLYASEENGVVELSTNPVTMDAKSRDMISWFPIFFPLTAPIYVPDNAIIEVSLWRQTNDLKVWYEWIVEVFVELGGKKVKLGGSNLHSSRKNACIM